MPNLPKPSPNPAFLGTGWSFPPQFSRHPNAVHLVSGLEDIHQSLHILLSTAPGERILQPEYGCALWLLVFQGLTTTLLTRAQELVRVAIITWEPRIAVDSIDVTTDPQVPGMLLIQVAFTVRATNTRSNLVYPFYFTEATIAPAAL